MRQINTKEDFDKVLAEAGDKPVLVDYYATWCGPCKKIAPYLEQLEQAYGDKAVFIKVDIEVNKETAEWAKISAMPTFHVMKNKAKVGELVGARQDKLAGLLEQHAGVPPGGPVAPSKPAPSANKGTDWFMFLVAGVVAWFGVTSTLLTIPRVSHPPVQSDYKPPVAYSEFTEYHLRTLPYSDLTQIFYQLDAPQQKLKGEYTAQLLDAGDIINNMIGAFTFTPIHPGTWVGKAFLEDEDFGYNIFFQYGKVKRRFTMQTRTGESAFDGKPVFELDYKKQRHILGWLNMRDEIREVRPGLYLGMGTFGLSPQKLMEPMPFYLRGPHAPAQKDVVTGTFRA